MQFQLKKKQHHTFNSNFIIYKFQTELCKCFLNQVSKYHSSKHVYFRIIILKSEEGEILYHITGMPEVEKEIGGAISNWLA